jgi:hypothetical protein
MPPMSPRTPAKGAAVETVPPAAAGAAAGAAGASSAEGDNHAAELEQLRGHSKRVKLSLQKLAAAILTPPAEADRGQGRRQAMRAAASELLDLVLPEDKPE